MNDFIIEPAERKGAPPLIAFWGPSTCGKTLTALLVARGYVGPKGTIGVIDTENKRALYHAAAARGEGGAPWLHLSLEPPFSPDRYSAACDALTLKGCDAIIIDSGSHVWEGEGGVLDMADKFEGHGLQKWKVPKTAYKRMVNHLLRAPIPIIWCLRSKEGFEQVVERGKKNVVNRGIVPISGKGLIYEMTISVLLGLDHKPAFRDEGAPYNAHPSISPVKMPDGAENLIQPGEYLGVQFGSEIAAWVNTGTEFNKHEAELLQVARDVATMGTERLTQHMGSLSEDDKKLLRPHWNSELKPLAKEYDAPPEESAQDDDPLFQED